MAIKKSITIKGINVEYWVVQICYYNKKLNKTYCSLVPYKDQATRNENANNFLKEFSKKYYFDGLLDVAGVYNKIKLLPEFENAIDI
jgi:hypothetical protein